MKQKFILIFFSLCFVQIFAKAPIPPFRLTIDKHYLFGKYYNEARNEDQKMLYDAITQANPEIEHISLSTGVMSQIPAFHSIAPRLKSLTLVYLGLKSICKDDLKFPKLRRLAIHDNDLTSIPSDLFEYTPNLEQLDLSYNGIEQVGRGCFDNLKQLELIDMHFNQCIQEEFLMTNETERMDTLKTIGDACK